METTRDNLRKTVERLSGSAKDQEAYLRQLATAPSTDELALEFSDALMAAGGEFGDKVRTAAVLLDQYLTEISSAENADLWTVKALYGAPEWERVRKLARDVLLRMDEESAGG